MKKKKQHGSRNNLLRLLERMDQSRRQKKLLSSSVIWTCFLTVQSLEASQSYSPTASGDRKRDLPDWPQPFTEGLVHGECGSSGNAGETIPTTPPPQIPARHLEKTRETHQAATNQLKNPQRYFIGCALNAVSGWRGDHTRQLKPKTSQTRQQHIVFTPDTQCTSHLSASMVPRSGNTQFQWQSISCTSSKGGMNSKSSGESWPHG